MLADGKVREQMGPKIAMRSMPRMSISISKRDEITPERYSEEPEIKSSEPWAFILLAAKDLGVSIGPAEQFLMIDEMEVLREGCVQVRTYAQASISRFSRRGYLCEEDNYRDLCLLWLWAF